MKLLGSCGRTCGEQTMVTVCDLPAIDRLRLVSEADSLTLEDLSALDDGILIDIDYVKEEDADV